MTLRTARDWYNTGQFAADALVKHYQETMSGQMTGTVIVVHSWMTAFGVIVNTRSNIECAAIFGGCRAPVPEIQRKRPS